MTKSLTPYDPEPDRFRLQRYRILLAAQTDRDIRVMLEQLIDEAEERLLTDGGRLKAWTPSLLPAVARLAGRHRIAKLLAEPNFALG